MRLLLFLTLLLLTGYTSAQQRQIDSLIHLSTTRGIHDSLKLNIYIQICEICDIEDNLKYGRIANSLVDKLIVKARNNSEKEIFLRKKLFVSEIIEVYYKKHQQSDSVELYKNKRIEIARKASKESLINEQINGLAEHYIMQNKFLEAIDLYTNELKKSENTNNKKQIIFSLAGMTNTYSRLHNNEKAVEYELKKLNVLKEITTDSTEIAWEMMTLALMYYNNQAYDSAVNYCTKANIVLFKKVDERQKIYLLFRLAATYNEMKKYTEARWQFTKALDINKNLHTYPGDSVVRGVITSEIGQTYFYEKNYDKALHYKLKGLSLIKNKSEGDAFLPYLTTGQIYLTLKKYKLAEKYVLEAQNNLSERELDYHNQKHVAKTLSEIYFGMGNNIKGNEYLVKFYQLKDSMDKAANAEELLHKELNYEYEKKESKLRAEHEKENFFRNEEKKKQQLILYSAIGVLFLLATLVITILKSLRETREKNKIISEQKQEVEKQKHLVEEKQKEIIDSISYAKRLQEAILPPHEFVNAQIINNFIYYQPKDIVAGDFYWAEKVGDKFFIAAADSTGHGVPGAMVSVVCSNALNRTIKEFKLTDTGKILDKTRDLVLETFEKSASEVKDGMDISLLCIDSKNKNIYWSGANNPLWYILGTELIEIKADKQPIGKSDNPKPFTTHKIEYKKNTTFYLFTDGLADQFGGPNGKKFKYKQFSELLIKNNNLSQNQQAYIIKKTFSDWKGNLEQVDDVCVIGIKL